MALNLWPVPHGLEDLLNAIGVTGSNPNKVSGKCQHCVVSTRVSSFLTERLDTRLKRNQTLLSFGGLSVSVNWKICFCNKTKCMNCNIVSTSATKGSFGGC